jgi:hypothetical protein
LISAKSTLERPVGKFAVSAQQTATTPQCIPGCTADHAGQPANLRECSAVDQIGAVRGTVAGMSPGYVAVNRWQDPTGIAGEIVLFAPEHDDDLTGDAEPATYTPAVARKLAELLTRGAELVESQAAGVR